MEDLYVYSLFDLYAYAYKLQRVSLFIKFVINFAPREKSTRDDTGVNNVRNRLGIDNISSYPKRSY